VKPVWRRGCPHGGVLGVVNRGHQPATSRRRSPPPSSARASSNRFKHPNGLHGGPAPAAAERGTNPGPGHSFLPSARPRRKGEQEVDRFSHDGPLDLLRSYAWPCNLRELENIIERAVVCSHQHVEVSHLPLYLRTRAPSQVTTQEGLSQSKERRWSRMFEKGPWPASCPRRAR